MMLTGLLIVYLGRRSALKLMFFFSLPDLLLDRTGRDEICQVETGSIA